MSFPINVNIPNAPNDPADDQPEMKKNFANISGYLAVDHVLAGTIGDGFHKQVTYNSANIPGAIADPNFSVGFTALASALPGSVAIGSTSTIVQNFYANQNAILPRSAIRAFVTFNSLITLPAPVFPQPVIAINSFNVSSIVYSSQTSIQVTLKSGSVEGSTYLVSFTASRPGLFGALVYTIVGNVINITIASSLAQQILINIIVLQT